MHLALKGWIELPEGRTQRGIRLLDEDLPVIEPLGEIAAGEPVVAESRTTESLPAAVAERFRPRPSYFLTVRGDSMDRYGLHDGDLVAVCAGGDACDGKIVVARIDNEVTLKCLVRLNAREVELRPESHNRTHRATRINLERTALDIDGFVVGAVPRAHVRVRTVREEQGKDRAKRVSTDGSASVQSANRAKKILDVPAPAHQFREPEDLAKASGGMQLLVDLIGTRAFQRLKRVHFLGAMDYSEVPHPNGKNGWVRHTRYEHSTGVMQLALRYAELRDLDTRQRTVLCAAALLHDIGHPPLSHSVESVFKQALDIDHHRASIDIIGGKHPLGAQVRETLREKINSFISQVGARPPAPGGPSDGWTSQDQMLDNIGG